MKLNKLKNEYASFTGTDAQKARARFKGVSFNMIEREEVAMFAAKILAAIVFTIVFVSGLLSEKWSFGIIVGALIFSVLFWVIGFLFTTVLLWPLEKIYRKVGETQAFVIFLIVGTLVPVVLLSAVDYVLNTIVTDEKIGFGSSILLYGALGAITASSAWWFLKNNGLFKYGN